MSPALGASLSDPPGREHNLLHGEIIGLLVAIEQYGCALPATSFGNVFEG
jgi:hypothetical protein